MRVVVRFPLSPDYTENPSKTEWQKTSNYRHCHARSKTIRNTVDYRIGMG